MSQRYSEAAAKWWGSKIRNIAPKNFDNGDPSNAGSMRMAMAMILAMNSHVSNQAIDMFEAKLAEAIENAVDERGGFLGLSVGYHPDEILADVAEKCGIPTELFPWNTAMRIEENRVSVRDGYGAMYETIFPV